MSEDMKAKAAQDGLIECPFCEAKPAIAHKKIAVKDGIDKDDFVLRCKNEAGFSTSHFETLIEAANQWNAMMSGLIAFRISVGRM